MYNLSCNNLRNKCARTCRVTSKLILNDSTGSIISTRFKTLYLNLRTYNITYISFKKRF